MLGVFGRLNQFVDEAVSGGYVLAVALICLLQYAAHLYLMNRTRRQYAHYRHERDGLKTDLASVQKDRMIAVLENTILREFVAQTELDRSLDVLLRRYIPNPSEAFAAFLHRQEGEYLLLRSRGMSDETSRRIVIDDTLSRRVMRERVVALEGAELAGSEIAGTFSNEDRGKARQLTLIAVGDGQDLAGILLTTALYPAGASREQQLELARRLMISVTGNLKRSHTLAMQEHQIRLTGEMLELRGISDRQYDTPARMLDAFLNCLRSKLGADRGVLFLTSPGGDLPGQAAARCGIALPPHLAVKWHEHEETLVVRGGDRASAFAIDPPEMDSLGIDTLIGTALVVPLSGRRGSLGGLCLAKQTRESFTSSQVQLASWAGSHLAETIARLMAHAAVERQARQDALTELANRRAFDQQIEHELSQAERHGGECSLLLFDIDRFKSVNDTYGHQAGDEVLRATARVLKDQVMRIRSGDRALIARYGGEEMAVLLPGIGTAGAARIAETIRKATESAVVAHEGRDIRVTISGGLSCYPHHGENVAELIAAADASLYEAKATGRNRVVTATEAAEPAHEAFAEVPA